ncbi:MAG: hypothetical protein SFT81_00935 [Candidatus Caenarcaniphilales bacterium]|nr:hypothetical protein [Candidatus Caenarcaniphilales bacterium]
MKILYQSSFLHVGMVLLLLVGSCAPLTAASFDTADLAILEIQVLGAPAQDDSTEERLSRLEKSVFGEADSKLSADERLKRLKSTLTPTAKPTPKEFQLQNSPYSEPKESASPIESNSPVGNPVQLDKLADLEDLSNQMLKIINEERSIRHLNPLQKDKIATKVALEQANYLAQTGQFSNYGINGKNPDLRYTEAGGKGRVAEVVDGYFAALDQDHKVIPISYSSSETPHQLMDAINDSPDKADAVFNNEANFAGIGFVLDPEQRQLVAVIEIVAVYGSLSDIPKKIGPSGIEISGKLSGGYRLAWIGLSHAPLELQERNEIEPSPYFAPIDKVVYLDQTGDRAKTIAAAGGIILAMVAAPFTYGASAIVADILMNMVSQTYQLHDVQVRNGVNGDVDGNFRGRVDLGEWGPGVYYVSVWAYRHKKEKPVVVSRRAVLVG